MRVANDAKASLPQMNTKPLTTQAMKSFMPLRIAGVFVNLFSKVGQRPSPYESKKEHVRLISIAVSNYVEKVRWGLDLLEANPKSPIYYTEDLHAPALASLQTVPASKDQASQSPMAILKDGKAIWDSSAILRALCSDPQTVNLYPEEIADDIQKLEVDLANRLGATARCFGYFCLFDNSKQYYKVASKFLTLHCPTVEQTAFDKMLPNGLAKGMKQLMKVDEFGEASEQEIRQVFQEMSQRLDTNGGEYLMNTPSKNYGFTAADLSFCSLCYFIIRPPEMGPFLVPESEFPPKLLHLGKELRETTAGKHVLKMYQKHRPVDSQKGVIVLKKVDQNRIPWLEVAGTVSVLGAVIYGFM